MLSACTTPTRHKAGDEHPLRAYLTLSGEAAPQIMPGLAGRTVAVKLANAGSQPVRLDKRLLNIVELVRVRDGNGHELANVPPPVPRLLKAGDVLVVRPGSFWQTDAVLRGITGEDLSGPYYRVSFCYDSTGVDYPTNLGIWKGKVCADDVVIRRGN